MSAEIASLRACDPADDDPLITIAVTEDEMAVALKQLMSRKVQGLSNKTAASN